MFCVEFSSYTNVVHNEVRDCSMVVLDTGILAYYLVHLCTKNGISGKTHMNGSGSSSDQWRLVCGHCGTAAPPKFHSIIKLEL